MVLTLLGNMGLDSLLLRNGLGNLAHVVPGGVIGKGTMRHPLGGGAWGGLLEHLVDLLERQTLCLRDEKPGEEDAGGAGGAPNEKDLGLEVALFGIYHVGGDVAEDL